MNSFVLLDLYGPKDGDDNSNLFSRGEKQSRDKERFSINLNELGKFFLIGQPNLLPNINVNECCTSFTTLAYKHSKNDEKVLLSIKKQDDRIVFKIIRDENERIYEMTTEDFFIVQSFVKVH
eukprot:TRINITY_DN6434_c0_g2_i8.p1 TRINITY_DN6434_c0_g2~~TRINITY_DN6434_c0_g2_i8.p1  ORF type:complete len:122 (+),score=17.95 TRINITY_DN6434_c0_g2_i8:483-848(+)